jgi:hypothetical protein
MKACHEAMEADTEKTAPNSGMMHSTAEHQEACNEDAIVKPVEGWKKQHRGRNQAAGQRGELKELTQGDCGSQRELAATCRKVFHHARMAWYKGNFDSGKLWTTAGIGCWQKDDPPMQEWHDARKTSSENRTNRRKQTVERPAMQNGNKGLNHEWHRRVDPRRASTSGKRRNIQESHI